MDTITFYLMGQMSWIPQFNFPRFDFVAGDLRERLTWQGKKILIVSPAELDDPEVRAEALASPDGAPGKMQGGHTWGDFLARDLKLIADGNEITNWEPVAGCVGMEDWWKSKGARVESFNARVLDKPLIRYTDQQTLRFCNPDEIRKAHDLRQEEIDRYYSEAVDLAA